jgi:hypothetical protein
LPFAAGSVEHPNEVTGFFGLAAVPPLELHPMNGLALYAFAVRADLAIGNQRGSTGRGTMTQARQAPGVSSLWLAGGMTKTRGRSLR